MRKGLARQVRNCYPEVGNYQFLNPTPPVGAAIPYVDPQTNNLFFNLVTKNRFYEKPTYESLLASLYNLKSWVISTNTRHLSLPKLGVGYDQLYLPHVFTLIRQVFDDLPIHIYLH